MDEAKLKISYLGVPGSYSHQACTECFPGAHYSGMKKFDKVIRAADSGEVDYAILPVENSSAGRVTEVYNLLPSVKLQIIGEYLLPIHHSIFVSYKAYRQWVPPHLQDKDEILAWKSSPLTAEEKAMALSSIKEVHSHSQALMQCSDYLEANLPKAMTLEDFDTATAGQNLARLDTKERAVIASKHAGQIYSLLMLSENIENDPHNMTRFLVFGKKPLAIPSSGTKYLTSILFQTNHIPGSLIGALKAFADNGINLTKLETYMVNQIRPNPTFYIDVGSAIENPAMQKALESFKQFTKNFDILGSYPASIDRGNNNSFLPVE
jgi:prephenate dehydratase